MTTEVVEKSWLTCLCEYKYIIGGSLLILVLLYLFKSENSVVKQYIDFTKNKLSNNNDKKLDYIVLHNNKLYNVSDTFFEALLNSSNKNKLLSKLNVETKNTIVEKEEEINVSDIVNE